MTNELLFNRDRIIQPRLHINLGLIKQFGKLLEKMVIVSIISPKPFLVLAWKNLKQVFLMDPKFANYCKSKLSLLVWQWLRELPGAHFSQ